MCVGDANVPLNATQVKTLQPGAYADGGGLHLHVRETKLNKKKGHPSVHYDKAPALMAELHNDPGRVARCVEVGILTIARSQEIRLMEWTEIDFDKRTLLCPPEKMKIKGDGEGHPHLVPLTDGRPQRAAPCRGPHGPLVAPHPRSN
jgi:integrase